MIKLILVIGGVLWGAASSAQGSWVPLTATAPHVNDGVMLLLTDGSVICKTSSGGTYGNTWDKLTPDAHGSYINGMWTTIAPMHDDRVYFSSQVLPDGRVYVAGGEYGPGGDKSEFYTPSTNTWTPCPQITFHANGLHDNGISDANSELLYTGKVLQSLVDTGATKLNFLWDPATNTYSPTGACVGWDNESPWVKLPDSTIIFNDNSAFSSERYFPGTGTWVNDGFIPGISLHDLFNNECGSAFLLPNGQCLFIGAAPVTDYYIPSGNASPGTWVNGPAIPGSLGAPDAAAAMMPNGIILMALSYAPYSPGFPVGTFFYEFDYTSNIFTQVAIPGGTAGPAMPVPSFVTNMLCLPDGTILYCSQGDDQYYEYVPGTPPLVAGQPAISNIIQLDCTNFTITGTLFNGITEGASYGDDWQMATNYPIVRLTSGTDVYYATTTNWNRIGAVMTGSQPDTAHFALPAGIPYGTYNVQVIANGNPSANFPLTIAPVTISPLASSICQGNTLSLSASFGTGAWTSSNISVATVDISTGIVSGVSGGTTTITYSTGTCNSLSTVTVNPAPAPIVPAPISLCTGSVLLLSDVTGGGTWSCSNTGIATVDISGNTAGISAGTATISYTTAGCSTISSITVDPLPAAISGAADVCSGSTITLSDAGGGTWSSSNSTLASVDVATGVVTGLLAGTLMITYSLGTGCYVSMVVTVNPLPGNISGSSMVCSGQSVTLSDGSPGGLWTSDNTSVATIGPGLAILSGITPGTSAISYTLSTGCMATLAVTVNPLPPAISGDPDLCVGLSTVLSDAISGGLWTSNNTSIAIVAGTGVVNGIIPGITTMTYTLSSGCSTIYGVNVHNIPSPIAGSKLCIGSSITLSDAVTGGRWTSSNTSVASVSTTGIVTGVTLGTADISYTLGMGCFATSTVTVAIGPVTITGDTSICIGTPVILSDITPSGTWSSTNTSVAAISSTGIVNGIVPGTSTISYSLSAGCATTIFVTINQTPIPHVVTGGGAYCAGGTGVHVGINPSDIDVKYELFLGSSLITSSLGTSSALDFGPQTTAGTYKIIATDVASGCTSQMTDSAIIIAYPFAMPSVGITAIPGDTICYGTYVTFSAIPFYGGASPFYQWEQNSVLVATGPKYSPSVVNNGDIIKCTMTSDYPCVTTTSSVSSSMNLYVKPSFKNVITIKASNLSVSYGVPDTFIVISPNGGLSPIYQWYLNGLPVPGATKTLYITSGLTAGEKISCRVTSSDECTLPATNFSNSITILGDESKYNIIHTSDKFRLWPNPNKGEFTITHIADAFNAGEISIIVTDMLGQEVFNNIRQASGNNVSWNITLGQLIANGMYFVKVTQGADIAIFHVVVNR